MNLILIAELVARIAAGIVTILTILHEILLFFQRSIIE